MPGEEEELLTRGEKESMTGGGEELLTEGKNSQGWEENISQQLEEEKI